MTRVLFVCTGNICRSPLAEGIFLHLAGERGVADRFEVDSAGTGGWHEGERPDPRSVAVAAKHGVELPGLARPLRGDDGDRFDLLVAMDRDHEAIMAERGVPRDKLRLIRRYDADAVEADALDVPDPYYGGPDGFDRVYAMLERACEAMLDELTG